MLFFIVVLYWLTLAVPPPLPTSTVPANTTNYKRGRATELLEQQVQNLKQNDQVDFRSNAGKILSLMLDARLNEQQLPEDDKTVVATTQHPLKKVIEICDKPLSPKDENDNHTRFPIPPPPPPAPQKFGSLRFKKHIHVENNTPTIKHNFQPELHTNGLKDVIQEIKANHCIPAQKSVLPTKQPLVDIVPKTTYTPPKSATLPRKTFTNSISIESINNNTSAPTPIIAATDEVTQTPVVFRNKDSRSELTSRARDRRSYIAQDQQVRSTTDDTVSPIVGNGATVQTTSIASELKDGKHPVCSCCNTKISR